MELEEVERGTYRSEHQTHDGGGLILKWWPIIAVALAMGLSGLVGFSAIQRDVSTVATELAAHEKAQAETIRGMQEDLKYIRDRVDRALEKKQ